MPYGVAMSCDGTPRGTANIDLTGLPFVLAEEFCEQGVHALGGTSVSTDRRIANLSGGGDCGWASVTKGDGACVDDPINANGGRYLNLAYQR
jgi:hypothetical protein